MVNKEMDNKSKYLYELATQKKNKIIDINTFVQKLIEYKKTKYKLINDVDNDSIFIFAEDILDSATFEHQRKYNYMSIDEEVKLIMDNIGELYAPNKDKKSRGKTIKDKGIKYIIDLATNRKNKIISSKEFLEELLGTQLKFHTHFGKDFEKYVEKIAVDLDGMGGTWRKLGKKMSDEEQEKVIIDNIMNLYLLHKKPKDFPELNSEKVKYY